MKHYHNNCSVMGSEIGRRFNDNKIIAFTDYCAAHAVATRLSKKFDKVYVVIRYVTEETNTETYLVIPKYSEYYPEVNEISSSDLRYLHGIEGKTTKTVTAVYTDSESSIILT
jgi:hypothetical protein